MGSCPGLFLGAYPGAYPGDPHAGLRASDQLLQEIELLLQHHKQLQAASTASRWKGGGRKGGRRKGRRKGGRERVKDGGREMKGGREEGGKEGVRRREEEEGKREGEGLECIERFGCLVL